MFQYILLTISYITIVVGYAKGLFSGDTAALATMIFVSAGVTLSKDK